MEILILLILVSLALAGAAVAAFAWTLSKGSHEHAERLALLPIEDDLEADSSRDEPKTRTRRSGQE